MQPICSIESTQLLTGVPSLLAEKLGMIVVDSVIPRNVELCGAMWGLFSNEDCR